jgi:hydrogenase expression/formation protein HypC
MCLAVPALVIDASDPHRAVVELDGVRKRVSLALVEGVVAGNYVIIHVGFALQKLDTAEAERTLAAFAEIGAAAGA